MSALPPLPDWVHRLPASAHHPAGLAYLRECLQALATEPPASTDDGVLFHFLPGHDPRQADRARRESGRAFLAAWKRMRQREKKLRRRGLLMPAASDEPPAQGPWNPP